MAYANPQAVVDLVQRTQVHRDVFVDQDIFELELKHIYHNTWVYVAYEDEIPNPGDFVTRQIGRQPIIVTRDDEGGIQLLMNRCTHRGATVCRAERGHSDFLKCPYHGWIFRNNGKLADLPMREDYDADLDLATLDLKHAAKVGSYRGFIFASLSADVPTLEEHLGNARKYLDWYSDVSIGLYEMELPQRVSYAANWKLIMDNTLDGYHAPYTHESSMPLMQNAFPLREKEGESRDLGNGHGTFRIQNGTTAMVDKYLEAADPNYVTALKETLGDERMRSALRDGFSGTHLRIFPNLLLLRDQIRVIYPKAVDRTEFSLAFFYPRGTGDAERARRRHQVRWVMGHGGFNTPDDVELFARVQEGLQVESADWYFLGKGLANERVEKNGELVGGREDEQPQRSLYYEWQKVMQRASTKSGELATSKLREAANA